MTEELLQNIYTVFSKYRLNDKISSCYCGVCMTEEFSDYLHKIPLKDLTANTLQDYISCVGIAEGDCNDFKYFLPRILELIYNESVSADLSEFYIFIWGVLKNIDYSIWQEEERLVFINFFNRYWDKVKEPEDIELTHPTIENIKSTVLEHFSL